MVDRTRDEGWDVFLGAEDVWVRVGEGCGSLDGCEVDFADAVAEGGRSIVSECGGKGGRSLRIDESERRSSLADCDPARYSDDVLIKGTAMRILLARLATLTL